MNLAGQVYSVYEQLYNESTEDYWIQMAETLGYSVEILQEIFEPKEGEYDLTVQFVEEYLEDHVMIRELLHRMDDHGTDVVEIDAIRNAFIEIMNNMELSDVQEILDDDNEYYFSIALCEGILIAIEEALMTMIQEGF